MRLRLSPTRRRTTPHPRWVGTKVTAVTSAGALATETDTGIAGVAIVVSAGTLATETDTGAVGVAVVVSAGSQATETDTGVAGVRAITKVGIQATTTDSLNIIYEWVDETVTDPYVDLFSSSGGVVTTALDTSVMYRGLRSLRVDYVSGVTASGILHGFSNEFATVTNSTWVRAQGFARSGSASAGSFQLSVYAQNSSVSSDIPVSRGGGSAPVGAWDQGHSLPIFFTTAAYGTGLGVKVITSSLTAVRTPLYFDDFSLYYAGVPALVIPGSQASGSDTGAGGAIVVTKTGTAASETDTGAVGALNVIKTGTLATETDGGAAGSAVVTTAGSLASETDSGLAGSAAITAVGTLATETDTGAAGALNVTKTGTLATETDTGLAGAAIVVVAATQASETDTGAAGALALTIPGSQATESDTGATAADSTVNGSQASTTDSGIAGVAVVSTAGSQASESDSGVSGSRIITGTTSQRIRQHASRNSCRGSYWCPSGRNGQRSCWRTDLCDLWLHRQRDGHRTGWCPVIRRNCRTGNGYRNFRHRLR
jgi:hypothetical protein